MSVDCCPLVTQADLSHFVGLCLKPESMYTPVDADCAEGSLSENVSSKGLIVTKTYASCCQESY